MAFQTKQREPMFDNNIKLIIDRRIRQLFGLFLLTIGVLMFVILFSYSPDDPSWLSSSGKRPSNLMGSVGASISSILFMIIGFGAWVIPTILIAWGTRFLFNKGWSKALKRLIFVPIAVALICISAATIVTPFGWSNPFGLGGLFGEMVIGSIKNVLSIDNLIEERSLKFMLFAISSCVFLFILGFTPFELRMLLKKVLIYCSKVIRSLSKSLFILLRSIIFLFEKSKNIEKPKPESEGVIFRQNVNPLDESSETSDLKSSRGLEKRPSIMSSIISKFLRPVLSEKKEDKMEPIISRLDIDEQQERIRTKISSIIENRSDANLRQPVYQEDNPVMSEIDDESVEDIFSLEQASGYEADLKPDLENTKQQSYSIDEPDFIQSKAPKSLIKYPLRKRLLPSKKAKSDSQPTLNFEDTQKKYELPPLNVLTNPKIIERQQMSDEALEENARMLEAVLDDYGVKGEIVSVRPGPVVTMYELEPAPGLKASRVIGLSDDIARSMSALSARVSTVPGRSVIGIELPNVTRETVVLKEILSSRDFGDGKQQLALALGKDIGGRPIVSNLAKMPHLLIAGTTGSGKSVAINTMILSLLYKLSPSECRMIMIDPKMLELSVYDGIPHLLSPVVTDPKKAVGALKWVVGEMEERYRKMSKMGVRNIDGFNGRVKETLSKGEMFSRTVQTGFNDETGDPVFETEEFKPEEMPYIVVVVDEMADLMMVAGKEIEACIQRLAQMARASGIHLIMATQRPSVDVITGTIKANFPTRISFQVTSKIDSRTILGEMGAEQLLGMGDMLYMAGGSKITRVHGPFVSDEEVEEVVNHLKSFGPPVYMSSVLEGVDDEKSSDIDLVLGLGASSEGENILYDTAVQIVINDRKCSTSYIQRKLAIGYNKAAKIVEQMEEAGLVSPANHVGKREILVPER
ncbi:MAG: DNA translocase FtsK [Paracoccaceae bacterium]